MSLSTAELLQNLADKLVSMSSIGVKRPRSITHSISIGRSSVKSIGVDFLLWTYETDPGFSECRGRFSNQTDSRFIGIGCYWQS